MKELEGKTLNTTTCPSTIGSTTETELHNSGATTSCEETETAGSWEARVQMMKPKQPDYTEGLQITVPGFILSIQVNRGGGVQRRPYSHSGGIVGNKMEYISSIHGLICI